MNFLPAGGIDRVAALSLFLILLFFCGGCPQTPQLVVKSDALSAEEHARLGAVYEREGDAERAVAEYGDALAKDPDNVVALTGLGNIALSRGKPRLAAGYYRRALDREPENVVVMNNLAMALLRAGKPKKAMEVADMAVAADNGPDPRVLETRALVLVDLGDLEGAEEDLAAASDRCESMCPGAGCDPNMEEACIEIKGRLEELGWSERE